MKGVYDKLQQAQRIFTYTRKIVALPQFSVELAEMHVPGVRPSLTVVTEVKVKPIDPHDPGHTLVKTPLSTSSSCVTPSSTSSGEVTTMPPPAPSSNNSRRNPTPTASSRSRGYKYCSTPQCASSDSISTPKAPPNAGPHVSTMNSESYFKLLKKSQVLEHLYQLSSHAGESDQQVRRLQSDKARAQCVQTRVFAELERYRKQVVDTQQQFLGLLESLTALCMREEAGSNESDDPVPDVVTAEERTLQDLQRVSSPTAKMSSSSSLESTIETRALAAVACQRVQQLEAICARYEQQLVGSEAALSQAIFSDAARESAAKIAQLEARNKQHEEDKKALEVQLELARGQAAHLHTQLTQTLERRTVLESEQRQLQLELTRHTTATQKFASDLQLELRRRYGVIPSVLDLKWQHYFPRLPRPLQ